MARGKDSVQKYIREAEKWAKHPAIPIILLLLAIFFAGFFRAYPVELDVTDRWAESSLQQQFISSAEAQLRQQFPLLPQQQLRAQANEQFAQFQQNNPSEFIQARSQLSQQFKSRLQFQPDGYEYEQTYLLAIDPYYYLRRAENLRETGSVCDEINDGRCWNTHEVAPHGREMAPNLHDYILAGFMTIAAIFGLAPITGAFFFPLIISSLAAIPAFFIVKRAYGSFAGFISAVVVTLHPAFLGRTPAGFADTDAWNVLIPLLAIWIFLIGQDQESWKRKLGYTAASAVIVALYSELWAGWFFTLFLFVAVLIGSVIFDTIRYFWKRRTTKRRQLQHLLQRAKESLYSLAVFVGVTGVLVSIINGPRVFFSTFVAPFSASSGLQDAARANLWPNVYTTVAELNNVSLAGIVSSIGGRLFFLIAIFGIFTYSLKTDKMDMKRWAAVGAIILFYFMLTTPQALRLSPFLYLVLFSLPLLVTLLYNVHSDEKYNIHLALIMMGWFVASIYATVQGTRFLLLLVPIIGLATGLAAGWFLKVLPPIVKKQFSLSTILGQFLSIAIVCVLLFVPLGASSPNVLERAHNVGINEVPSMNDAWWQTLNTIEEVSSEDAIITSWWDFGHWFKYVADRQVTFDGGSQNRPQAHWVGKLFQVNTTEESLAILRMLNCGANTAYDIIEDELGEPVESYQLLSRVLKEDESDARQILSDAGMNQEDVGQIIERTFCSPPESFLIVSQDMIGKAGVWGHFGTWSFERAQVYQTSKQYPASEAIPAIAQRLNISESEARQLHIEVTALTNQDQVNAWISPWPQYVGGGSCQENNETIICRSNIVLQQQQGVNVVLSQITVPIEEPEKAQAALTAQGQVVATLPISHLSLNGNTYTNAGGELTIGVRIQNTSMIIADPLLLDSVFTQLFYDEQPGPYLSKVSEQQQVTGGKILVYEVNWEEYINSR